MPDFFDRLIARGAPRGYGGLGRPPVRRGGLGGIVPPEGSSAAVTFARPRLPGPFELLAPERQDAFLEAVDEVREAGAAHPEPARARPALGSLDRTQAAITPPPLLHDDTTARAPGRAPAVPGEQPSVRPAPQQAPILPSATPVHPAADAGAAAPDQASARVGRPAGEVWRGGEPLHAGGPRGVGPREVAGPSRTLAVPASAVRPARPAAGEARTAQAQPPAPPPVTVRIGRIEVRNGGQDRRERQAKKRPGRVAPKQTLAEYLAAAGGGRNGSGAGPGGAR
jgi:hypothetical protein